MRGPKFDSRACQRSPKRLRQALHRPQHQSASRKSMTVSRPSAYRGAGESRPRTVLAMPPPIVLLPLIALPLRQDAKH